MVTEIALIGGQHGDLNSAILHYETLAEYYADALSTTRNIQTELRTIAQARVGLADLERHLAQLRSQIDCARIGEVIEEIWIVTLVQMTELMSEILKRRTRIAAATTELNIQRKSLVQQQQLLTAWYAERETK